MIPWRQAASQENVHYGSYYERSVQYRAALSHASDNSRSIIPRYLHIPIKSVQFTQTVQIVQYCQRGMDMITHAKIREKYKYVIKRFEEEGIISV